MKKQIIRLTEADLHRIIRESVKQYLREEGEGGISGSGFAGGFSGAGDGSSNCTGALQTGANKKGDENPDAGTYITKAFGADNDTSKRSKDFKNGSMMTQVAPSQSRKK